MTTVGVKLSTDTNELSWFYSNVKRRNTTSRVKNENFKPPEEAKQIFTGKNKRWQFRVITRPPSLQFDHLNGVNEF